MHADGGAPLAFAERARRCGDLASGGAYGPEVAATLGQEAAVRDVVAAWLAEREGCGKGGAKRIAAAAGALPQGGAKRARTSIEGWVTGSVSCWEL